MACGQQARRLNRTLEMAGLGVTNQPQPRAKLEKRMHESLDFFVWLFFLAISDGIRINHHHMHHHLAYEDPTRCKAPCEFKENEGIQLYANIRKKEYNAFLKIPSVPQVVNENMASILAKSGELRLSQAQGSYKLDVPSMKCYGLFIPTGFTPRPPFQDNDSNVYHILHGTSPKEASLIQVNERFHFQFNMRFCCPPYWVEVDPIHIMFR